VSKSYVKLKNVGDAATFTVVRCAEGTGTYPDVEFEDREGRVYPVPKVSADRQLGRLGVAEYADVVGNTITISRSENKKAPDKPFWNIELASGAAKTGGASNGATAGTTQPPATAQAPAPTNGKEKDSALYLRMTEFVLKDVRNVYETHGYQMPADVAAAITATLFIQAKR
jgi:hypothetical protein